MIKAAVWDDQYGNLHVDTMIDRLDDYVEIPPKLYEKYLDARRELFGLENIIRTISGHRRRFDDTIHI